MEKAELSSEAKTTVENSELSPKSVSNKVKPKQAKSKTSCGKHSKAKNSHKKKLKAKQKKVESSSDSDSSSDESSTSAESESESESEPEPRKKRKTKAKRKRRGRQVIVESTSDSSDSEDSSSEEEVKKAKTTKKSKTKTKAKAEAEPEAEAATPAEDPNESRIKTLEAQVSQLSISQTGTPAEKRRARRALRDGEVKADDDSSKPTRKAKRASKVAFKRVDQLWDASIHNFKLTETVDDPDADEFDQYIFTVRRQFDWEHKYEATYVDVRGNPLKEALKEAMKDVKGLSFVQETPCLDPQMLFLFLDEFKKCIKQFKSTSKTAKKKKARAEALAKAEHLKVLVKYLDKDFAATKKSLYPLLENNMITFDLLWALYKPNTVVYSSTYADNEQPRAFKMEFASKVQTLMHGTWYNVEGRYLEYDGKSFGMGKTAAKVDSFKGSRKISSLACYPIKYHKNLDKLTTQLIERGRKFVALKGMNYRSHQGMAYVKKKQQILRININGRIMIDPAVFRRINPNYQVSSVKPKVEDDYFEMTDEEDSECDCCESGCEGEHEEPMEDLDEEKPRKKYREIEKEDGSHEVVEVKTDDEDIAHNEKLESRGKEPFTDEELLIASPVVLGFAFNEKLWLEFTVSGINEVKWNTSAFDSLVLPEQHKSIVKSLVTSHKFSAAKNIDDVIAGKGKGLVAVLHGPPGTGKTLTAEGIAELLKCPLYMVSAGELGTDPRTLERGLQEILDIAHAWGAVLLLDEADVFLEQRSIHDIHRNALVSIFLRLLEYFQGILFLTTNRVETFDDAFQSRIHVALKYTELPLAARLTVWRQFITRVRELPDSKVAEFTEKDFQTLAKEPLNGRQIKNATRAAQALALTEESELKMEHLTRVLGVARSFERDLKGGTGYEDAMRSYY